MAETHKPTYYVGTGISFTDLGLWWPVLESHAKCGCGAVEEMGGVIAYFGSREMAQQYVNSRTHSVCGANPGQTSPSRSATQ